MAVTIRGFSAATCLKWAQEVCSSVFHVYWASDSDKSDAGCGIWGDHSYHANKVGKRPCDWGSWVCATMDITKHAATNW